MNISQVLCLLVFFLPAFAIAFLVVWHFSRHKPNFLKITLWASLIGAGAAVLICGGLAATFIYLMSNKETDHFTTPLTVEQARQQGCPISLPDSARNVQFVTVSGGLQALEILVRFEAPVDVCKSHVQTVFSAWAKQTGRPVYLLPVTPLAYIPPPEVNDMVGRADWFDADKIDHGYSAGDGNDASYAMQIWIDEDRGVFYCKITD